jgi:hypothetical protein
MQEAIETVERVHENKVAEVKDLTELELAYVGGGIADLVGV